MIYYFVVLILGLYAFLNVFEEDKKKLLGPYFVSIALLLVFGGLRYEVGADWFSYKKIFEEMNSLSIALNAREEKLFALYFYVMGLLSLNYSMVVFVFFAISFLIKVYVIDKYSTNVFLSYVIYFSAIFLIYDINGIRQGMAIGVVLLSIPSILERKLPQFLMIMTIAAFIHTSAIVFIPFYFVANVYLSIKWIVLITVSVLIVSIPLREFMLTNPLFALALNSDSLTHYSSYLDDEVNKSVEIISIAVFQRVFFLIVVIYNFDKIELPENQKRLFLNGYFISFLVFMLFSFSTEFAARLCFYYKSFEMILLPLVVSAQKRPVPKILYFTIFLVLSVIAVQRLVSVKDGGLLPYKLYLLK